MAGMWPDDVDYTIVTGRLARVTVDGGDLDSIPDFRAQVGRVVITPDLREVRYSGGLGVMMLSLDVTKATIGPYGNVLAPDGQSVLSVLASDSRNLEQTGWTYSVRFELEDGTWGDVSHVLAPAGGSIDLARLAVVAEYHGVEKVADTVTIDRANAAAEGADAATTKATDAATKADAATTKATDAAQRAATAAANCDATASGADATATTHGLMSASDKRRLDSLVAGQAPNPNLIRDSVDIVRFQTDKGTRDAAGFYVATIDKGWLSASRFLEATVPSDGVYTFSFDSSDISGASHGVIVTISVTTADGNVKRFGSSYLKPGAGRASASMRLVAGDARIAVELPPDETLSTPMTMSRPKLELGATATPWVPHADDYALSKDVPTRQQLADAVRADSEPTAGSGRLVTSGGVHDALGRLPLDVRGMHVHRFGLGSGNTLDNRGASYHSNVTRLSGCYVEELALLIIDELEANGNINMGDVVLPSYVMRPSVIDNPMLGKLVAWEQHGSPFKTWNRVLLASTGSLYTTFDVGSGVIQTLLGSAVACIRAFSNDDVAMAQGTTYGAQLLAASMAKEVL